VAAFTFILSFYPVNNRPFSLFLEAAVKYLKGNKLYLWRKKGSGVYGQEQTEEITAPVYMPPAATGHIASLSRRLEMKAIQRDSSQ
jgi:hypothetical protein